MRHRKSSELRDAIESDILRGRYRPGERLDEQTLARRFGVSRTPIREALLQLQSSGLIQFHANRGAFVAELSSTDVLEMYELRTEIEAICGRLAAHRATPDTVVALGRALQACERAAEANDLEAYFAANDQFHEVIYAMAGNKQLAQTAGSLYRRLKFFRHIQLSDPNRIVVSLAEHRAIVAAISARDAERAEAVLKDHALTRGERFVSFLASLADEEASNRIAV
jgi:DNA-binding GntR family transcriptional regulator